jgi:Holliday junction resolvase
MADTPEKKVKNAVRKVLDRLGIYYFMPPGMGLGRSGIPDIIGCYNGCFIAIECKAGKGQLTALQARELNAIKAAGGFTFVAREDNLEEMEGRLLLWTK